MCEIPQLRDKQRTETLTPLSAGLALSPVDLFRTTSIHLSTLHLVVLGDSAFLRALAV